MSSDIQSRDWHLDQMRKFAEKLPEDLGPCFGRDVCRLIDSLKVERAQRRWAFAQLREWWRGVPRDMSDSRVPIGELDRVEAKLDNDGWPEQWERRP